MTGWLARGVSNPPRRIGRRHPTSAVKRIGKAAFLVLLLTVSLFSTTAKPTEVPADLNEPNADPIAAEHITNLLIRRTRAILEAVLGSCLGTILLGLGFVRGFQLEVVIDDWTDFLEHPSLSGLGPPLTFPATSDPFTALGALAAVAVAISLYDRRLDWQIADLSLDDYERLVTSIRTKQTLVFVAVLMCVCSWLIIWTALDGGTAFDWLQVLLSVCLLALCSNFIATRREELRLTDRLNLELDRAMMNVRQAALARKAVRWPWIYALVLLVCVVPLPVLGFATGMPESLWLSVVGLSIGIILQNTVVVGLILTSAAARLENRRDRPLVGMMGLILAAMFVFGNCYVLGNPLGWQPTDLLLVLALMYLPVLIGGRQLWRYFSQRLAAQRMAQMRELEQRVIAGGDYGGSR